MQSMVLLDLISYDCWLVKEHGTNEQQSLLPNETARNGGSTRISQDGIMTVKIRTGGLSHHKRHSHSHPMMSKRLPCQ